MNIFRLAGDVSHLVAIVILLMKIWWSKSCAGMTQISLFIFFNSLMCDWFDTGQCRNVAICTRMLCLAMYTNNKVSGCRRFKCASDVAMLAKHSEAAATLTHQIKSAAQPSENKTAASHFGMVYLCFGRFLASTSGIASYLSLFFRHLWEVSVAVGTCFHHQVS